MFCGTLQHATSHFVSFFRLLSIKAQYPVVKQKWCLRKFAKQYGNQDLVTKEDDRLNTLLMVETHPSFTFLNPLILLNPLASLSEGNAGCAYMCQVEDVDSRLIIL